MTQGKSERPVVRSVHQHGAVFALTGTMGCSGVCCGARTRKRDARITRGVVRRHLQALSGQQLFIPSRHTASGTLGAAYTERSEQ